MVTGSRENTLLSGEKAQNYEGRRETRKNEGIKTQPYTTKGRTLIQVLPLQIANTKYN